MIHPPAGQAQSLSGGIAKGHPTEEELCIQSDPGRGHLSVSSRAILKRPSAFTLCRPFFAFRPDGKVFAAAVSYVDHIPVIGLGADGGAGPKGK